MTSAGLTIGPHVRPDGGLAHGLRAGELSVDPIRHGPAAGRARRWLYAAAGGDGVALGAAVVSLGPVGTVFVWAAVGDTVLTWERRVVLGRGLQVGPLPAAGARYAGRGARVTIDGCGGLTLEVPGGGAPPLRASVSAAPSTPVVLVTPTPGGGWNATEKRAGYPVEGWMEAAGRRHRVEGGGWRDWTAGRQDRHTTWRWAAGAGTSGDGRRVGLNVSTGMNGAGAGEDVVWWDGHPWPVEVTTLGPVGIDPAGPWTVAGPGWALHLEPWGRRAADEDLFLVRSRYVQPIGRLHGTLPGPDGAAVDVDLVGVTEDHAATW